MPHDVSLYRSFAGNVRWTFRRQSVFDLTAHLGDGLFDLAVVGAFAFGDARARRTSIEGVEALFSVAATSVVLKHIFRVARPSTDSHWPSDVIAGAALGYLIGRTSIVVNARHLSVAPIPAGISLAGDL